MNDVTFNRGSGALGRPLPNRDHVSAICYPITTLELPSGFAADDRIKKVFSVDEAEALGINTGADNSVVRLHYQITEVYRLNPKAELYIYIYDPLAANAGVYLQPVIEHPENGEIRQVGVFIDDDLDAGFVSDIQEVVEAMRVVHRPFSAVIAYGGISNDYNWSTAPDLRALACDGVSVVVAHDVDGRGGELATLSARVPALGAVLGAISAASVHESIGWVGKFNFSNGTELERVAIGHKDTLVNEFSANLLTSLANKGYIFMRKHIGITGTYAVDSQTSDLITSDYAYIENTRTMDKAIRGVRARLLPQLSSPVYLNEDGTLREDTVANIRAIALKSLDEMQQAGEISARDVIINPAQPILQTSTLVIGIKIVPVGVARQIEVNISFALSVSN